MEFNVPNPDAKDYPEALGISPERQMEISLELDRLVKSYGTYPVYVWLHHTAVDIAAFCKGPEEFSYALILHFGWLQRRGHQIAPR